MPMLPRLAPPGSEKPRYDKAGRRCGMRDWMIVGLLQRFAAPTKISNPVLIKYMYEEGRR